MGVFRRELNGSRYREMFGGETAVDVSRQMRRNTLQSSARHVLTHAAVLSRALNATATGGRRGRCSERIVDVMSHRSCPRLLAALNLVTVGTTKPHKPVGQELLDLGGRLVGKRRQRWRSWDDEYRRRT